MYRKATSSPRVSSTSSTTGGSCARSRQRMERRLAQSPRPDRIAIAMTNLGPTDGKLSLRPRLVLSRRWLAVFGAGMLVFGIAMIASDPEDRGETLRYAVFERLAGAKELENLCQAPDIAPPADPNSPEAIADLLAKLDHLPPPPDTLKLNYIDAPPRKWWQRLTRTQPFHGEASITLGHLSATCELRIRFEASIEWRDVFVTTHDRFGHPNGSSNVKHAYYAITDIRNVTGERH
jgi:hypothetical protein